MEFPFQNSIVFPEFHSLYEPWLLQEDIDEETASREKLRWCFATNVKSVLKIEFRLVSAHSNLKSTDKITQNSYE